MYLKAKPLREKVNKRRKQKLVVCLLVLAVLTIAGLCCGTLAELSDLGQKYAAPSFSHLFGTDQLGRDMLARTLKGLSTGILMGILATAGSGILGGLLGIIAALGNKKAEAVISWLTDLMMGIPQLILMVLIALALGKGFFGVFAAITLTHWSNITRLIKNELITVREAQYTCIARQLGVSPLNIAVKHYIPHILPQFLTGLILLFPHAILAEAGLTFLGFGLTAEIPSIGGILADSMQYMTLGMWWLAFFPGLMLLVTVLIFRTMGNNIKRVDRYE